MLLANGIGITPMISILRDLLANNYQQPVKLFYACRTQDDLLYQPELIDLVGKLNIKLHTVISESAEDSIAEKGRLDTNYLKQHINYQHYQDYLYFICGRSDFVKGTVEGLGKMHDKFGKVIFTIIIILIIAGLTFFAIS